MLFVEDDVRMAAAVRRALRTAGVVGDVATTGGDALWMVRAAEYDAPMIFGSSPSLFLEILDGVSGRVLDECHVSRRVR